MNILFVTNVLAPYRAKFFSEWGKLCDLTVIAEIDSVATRDKRWKAQVYDNYKYVALHKRPFYHDDTSVGLEIIKYLRCNKFDYVIFGVYTDPIQLITMEYCIKKSIPYVISDDGCFIKTGRDLFYYIKRRYVTHAAFCLTTSDYSLKTLKYYGAKNIYKFPFSSISEKNISKVSDIKKRDEYKKELNIKECFVVLCVGQYIYRKGIDILLKSATANGLTDVGIYIIGGEANEEYKKIVKKYSLRNINFVPFKSPDVLEKYYMASDCFVLPTRRDEWGLVINEAIAKGLPVITTNMCLAGRELIKNDINGYVIPVNNAEILSEKIMFLMKNKEVLKQMGKNNIKLANSYTIESMVKAHDMIFMKSCK